MAEESTKAPSGATPPPGTRVLDQGKRQFIIAPRRGSQALHAGLRPMSAGAVRALLGQLPGLEVRAESGVSGGLGSVEQCVEDRLWHGEE